MKPYRTFEQEMKEGFRFCGYGLFVNSYNPKQVDIFNETKTYWQGVPSAAHTVDVFYHFSVEEDYENMLFSNLGFHIDIFRASSNTKDPYQYDMLNITGYVKMFGVEYPLSYNGVFFQNGTYGEYFYFMLNTKEFYRSPSSGNLPNRLVCNTGLINFCSDLEVHVEGTYTTPIYGGNYSFSALSSCVLEASSAIVS